MLLTNKYLFPRCIKVVFIVLLLATLPFLWSGRYSHYENYEDIVNIGSRLELFVDSFLIEEQDNVNRILHTPEGAGNVLSSTSPGKGHSADMPPSLKTVMYTGFITEDFRKLVKMEAVPKPPVMQSLRMALTGPGRIWVFIKYRAPGKTMLYWPM